MEGSLDKYENVFRMIVNECSKQSLNYLCDCWGFDEDDFWRFLGAALNALRLEYIDTEIELTPVERLLDKIDRSKFTGTDIKL